MSMGDNFEYEMAAKVEKVCNSYILFKIVCAIKISKQELNLFSCS